VTGTAPPRYEAVYRVRFDEATPHGTLRTGALLGYLQDIAWLHSSALGFTREWYGDRNLAWLVRAIEIEVRQAIRDGDEIRLTTRIGGYRRVMARRVSEILAADGTPIGTALVDWAMTDGVTAVRVPDEFTSVPGVEHGPFTPLRVAIPAAPAGGAALDLVPRLRELDPMNHANNGVYADWFDEAVTAAGGGDLAIAAPRRLRIEYVRSATPAAALRSQAWPHDGGYAWRLADAGTGDEMAKGFLLGDGAGAVAGPPV
jgi:acyl-CoA thioesterase FadM